MSREDTIDMGAVTGRLRALARNVPLSILVIDDDELERTLIADRLKVIGFEVASAANGREGLAILETQAFPVLIVDWQMPVMDGIELTERLRARGLTEAYVIMLTAQDSSFDCERGYRAGVDDYLTKKVHDAELLARIHAGFNVFNLRHSLKEALAGAAAASKGNTAQTNVANRTPDTNFEDTMQVVPLAVTIAPKVLLVDDDELMLAHLKTLIAAAGFEVSTATEGEAALAALRSEFSPIVILDRNMPGMDGLALCRAIRQQTYSGYVYLMLLTAQDAEQDILVGLDAGADDYLSKRASTAQLVARLRTARRILSLEHSLRGMVEDRRRMAMTDVLTGTHNRRYFMRNLGRELKRLHRFGGELSLLALDIDHFKRVNDGYGHGAGDAVLREFVQRIQRCLPREYDWCARLGGEEFAVVLPQTNLAGASVVAEKLRSAVEAAPMHTDAGTLSVTVSIGVSGLEVLADRAAATAESLLNHADRYLYKAKENGRNRVTIAEPDTTD